MSGGVDSSVAAALLKEAGWEVIGLTLRLWAEERAECPGDSRGRRVPEAAAEAGRAAQSLGIPHYVVDMQEAFYRRVVENFMAEYSRGRTPNPCVNCNRNIKFNALLEKADELQAPYLATGHYARVEYCRQRGRYLLKKGCDARKDQSYMLYNLTQQQLARAVFPLGEMTKEEVRRHARRLGLAMAEKPESQEICFIPDNDYRAFLRRRGVAQNPGPIVDLAGRVLGTHTGVAFYTIGQRRGLGIAAPQPLYVLEIDPHKNAIVVGGRDRLRRSGMLVDKVNLVALCSLPGELEATVKIRYRSPETAARIVPAGRDGQVAVYFKEPQPAVAPGQAAVFYQGDLLIGGGTIDRPFGPTGLGCESGRQVQGRY